MAGALAGLLAIAYVIATDLPGRSLVREEALEILRVCGPHDQWAVSEGTLFYGPVSDTQEACVAREAKRRNARAVPGFLE